MCVWPPQPSIVRLGVLLLLFDVYLTWARIEMLSHPDPAAPRLDDSPFRRLAQQPIMFQYIFFRTSLLLPPPSPLFWLTPRAPPPTTVVLCSLSTLAFHLSIRQLTSSARSPLVALGLLRAPYARPNSVSTALLVSSSTKLFPILMVIWAYDVPAAARSLGWAVVANNVEALEILLDCGYGAAALLAAAGGLARWAVGRAVLWAAGLEGVDAGAGAGGSVAEDGRALWAVVLMVFEWAGRLAVG